LRFTKAALDANQFNVTFNVVGEVMLPTPLKSEIGKRLLAPVVVGTYIIGSRWGAKQGREGAQE
jgi:hypothetical protein